MRKRSVLLALFVCSVLFAGAAPADAQEMTDREKELYAAAKSEGSVTWYVAQYTASNAEKIGEAFSKRYPGIKANVTRSTGQVNFSRLQQDIRAKVPQCDVFSATDVSHAVELKKQKQLAHYVPENAAKMDKALQGLDPEGYFHTTAANPTVMIYNTNLVKKEDAPTNWPDLLDPKWKGKAAVGHPGFSGSAGSWALMMEKLYGKDFFDKLEKNKPQIGRSQNDPASVVISGERQIGVTGYANVVEAMLKGNPLAGIIPADGAKLTRGPSFILANAPHPNAARLFLEFLLSVPASEILVQNGQAPMRPEVSPPPGAMKIADMKMGPLSEADVEGIPELVERWRTVFGN